jgi:phosphopantothenoylcysteine decarboxylase/phosphopantothenate--cysteine ligase
MRRRRGGRRLRVLVSAGPTREPIDAVRFLSNYSTGYMGARLAAAALARGHAVTVVSGPVAEPLPAGARVVPVERAADMARALRRLLPRADALIMAAAVADFRSAHAAAGKRPRVRGLTLRLAATPDILAGLPRRPGQVIAGFALEPSPVLPRARRKLAAKRLDLLVAQRVPPVTRRGPGGGAPFGRSRVQAWLLERGGKAAPLGARSKAQIAGVLLDKVEALCYGQGIAPRRRMAACAC